MPQQKSPFSSFVASLKEYLAVLNPELKDCNCESYAHLPNRPALFTKQDLYVMATNRNGAGFFDNLLTIKRIALKTTTNQETGKPELTENAKLAIGALAELKPNNVGLIDYIKMIEEVAGQTEAIRAKIAEQVKKDYPSKKPVPSSSTKAPIKKSSAAVFEADHGITIDPSEDKGFDQQTALAILGERGVKVDVDQSHKTPNFEQEALKAVASLKNTVITRAA